MTQDVLGLVSALVTGLAGVLGGWIMWYWQTRARRRDFEAVEHERACREAERERPEMSAWERRWLRERPDERRAVTIVLDADGTKRLEFGYGFTSEERAAITEEHRRLGLLPGEPFTGYTPHGWKGDE